MMKPYSWITCVLGVFIFLLGVFASFFSRNYNGGWIPLLIGLALIYLGFKGGRVPLLVFGHLLIVTGCYLVTWGLYLLPYSKPQLIYVFARPLFWGMFSLFGGICAIYHGFCNCICRKKT